MGDVKKFVFDLNGLAAEDIKRIETSIIEWYNSETRTSLLSTTAEPNTEPQILMYRDGEQKRLTRIEVTGDDVLFYSDAEFIGTKRDFGITLYLEPNT